MSKILSKRKHIETPSMNCNDKTEEVIEPPMKKVKTVEINDEKKESKSRKNWKSTQKASKKFENYYGMQKIYGNNSDEFSKLLLALKRELPLCFRINKTANVSDCIQKQLKNDYFGLNRAKQDKIMHDSLIFDGLKSLKWYPNEMAWQSNFPNRALNKFPNYFNSFREFLIELNETGIISRMETVSMIPPLFMDIKPGHHVIDLCAGIYTGINICVYISVVIHSYL